MADKHGYRLMTSEEIDKRIKYMAACPWAAADQTRAETLQKVLEHRLMTREELGNRIECMVASPWAAEDPARAETLHKVLELWSWRVKENYPGQDLFTMPTIRPGDEIPEDEKEGDCING